MKEAASVSERAAVGAKAEDHEGVMWRAHAKVEKYVEGAVPGRHLPYEVAEAEGNLLMTAGALRIWKMLRDDAVTAFNNTNSRLGVGDSTTAAAVGQTDLQAASNKLRKGMDSGWPKVGVADGLLDAEMQFKATFGTTEANFAWDEWGTFDAASGGLMLNRKVQAFGTKASGTTWVLTVTLSLA